MLLIMLVAIAGIFAQPLLFKTPEPVAQVATKVNRIHQYTCIKQSLNSQICDCAGVD